MTKIQVEHLTKRFGRLAAVDNLSFVAREGRVTGLLGAHGSGKTTTLRVLLGLSAATAGTATIGCRRYADLTNPMGEVGAVIGKDTFHPGRSAAEYLSVLATAAEVDAKQTDGVLAAVGLADVAGRDVGGFSLGMRTRLRFAAALLGKPKVLILDEPLKGLGTEDVGWFRRLVRDVADGGGTVLFSSHLHAEVSHAADDVVVIAHGRLLATAPLNELRQTPVTVVRTPHAVALTAALLAAGYPAQRMNDEEVHVPGIAPDAVGLVAAHEGVVLTGLSEQRDDLEHLFRDLTNVEGTRS